ncbi:MAG: hypothetical protein LUD15_10805 [Bacteroides sp.]|nr:hypothetical protein [Bacteroides sp.]
MMKKKVLYALLVAGALSGCSTSRQTEITSENPIFEGWYADPEAIIFG